MTEDKKDTVPVAMNRDLAIRNIVGCSTYASHNEVALDTLAASQPERQMVAYSLRRRMMAEPWRALYGVLSPMALAGVISGILYLCFARLGGSVLYTAITAGIFGVFGMVAMIVCAMEALFVERDREVIKSYARCATYNVVELLRHVDTVSVADFRKAVTTVDRIKEDSRREIAEVRRRMVSTIAAIYVAHRRAIAAIGSGDRKRIDADAAVAVMRTLDAARSDIATIDEALVERDAAIVPPIAEEFSAHMAQLVSGVPRVEGPAMPAVTGNARINRIVDNARKGLKLDPDMVDDAGARVDALIDRHLPQLLERHAEASRTSRLEDLDGINADLDDGIELIRRSIDEGLARIRSAKAQELRTEIAFLRSRRGEDQAGLQLPP